PLLPLALSVVWRVLPSFPENLPILKGVCALAGLGLILLLPGYLRAAGLTPTVAIATAALTALAPLTARYATAIASELPFALLAVATLWATEPATGPAGRTRTARAAGLLGGLAFLTRTIGLAIIGGCLLTLLRRADRRRAAAFLVPAVLCVLPWAAWVLFPHAGGSHLDYMSELASGGPPGPAQVLRHVAELPAAVALVTLPGIADLLPAPPPIPVVGFLYVTRLAIPASPLLPPRPPAPPRPLGPPPRHRPPRPPLPPPLLPPPPPPLPGAAPGPPPPQGHGNDPGRGRGDAPRRPPHPRPARQPPPSDRRHRVG